MTSIKEMLFKAFVAGDTKGNEGTDEIEVYFEEWFKTTPWGKYEELKLQEVGIINNHLFIEWTRENIGFGQLTIEPNEKGIKIDHELMSKEFVESVMLKLVDKFYI